MAGHARRRRRSATTTATSTSATSKRRRSSTPSELAALMVTYPSTHGVYEERIGDICAIVHEHGGQVYLDGANLNALVGVARPGQVRRRRVAHQPAQDVLHPARRRRPRHRADRRARAPRAVPARTIRCSSTPDPTSGVADQRRAVGLGRHPADLVGVHHDDGRARGCRRRRRSRSSTRTTSRAGSRRTIPCSTRARDGLVAHECIIDLRPITAETGVTVDDVAKRLIDYGFHAPTMSFPVAGTLMIEPTESEDRGEIDRFIDAMIAIRAEIDGRRRRASGPPTTTRSCTRPTPRSTSRATSGRARTRASSPRSRCLRCGSASTGRRSAASTASTATATSFCSCPPIEAYEDCALGARVSRCDYCALDRASARPEEDTWRPRGAR